MPPDDIRRVADKALEAATRAELAAAIAKVESEGVRLEMRERFKQMEALFQKQDGESDQFRTWLRQEIKELRGDFNAFDTEVKDMNNRCKDHDDTIYGNEDRGIIGIRPKLEGHDNDIRKGKWTLALAGVLLSWAVVYVAYFYGDAMKRGIFNPSDEEWRWRINREIHKNVVPESLFPVDPTKGNGNG